jgi:hypothetical protein
VELEYLETLVRPSPPPEAVLTPASQILGFAWGRSATLTPFPWSPPMSSRIGSLILPYWRLVRICCSRRGMVVREDSVASSPLPTRPSSCQMECVHLPLWSHNSPKAVGTSAQGRRRGSRVCLCARKIISAYGAGRTLQENLHRRSFELGQSWGRSRRSGLKALESQGRQQWALTAPDRHAVRLQGGSLCLSLCLCSACGMFGLWILYHSTVFLCRPRPKGGAPVLSPQ